MFQRWWNAWLLQLDLQIVGELADEVRSGEKTIALAEVVTGAKARVHYAEPASKDMQLENNLAAMALLREAHIPVVSANGSSRRRPTPQRGMDTYDAIARRLTDGQSTAVASLTWSLILHTTVRTDPELSAKAALSELLAWVRTRATYYGLEVGHTRYAWSTNFADGRVWCALMHSFDSSLFSFEESSQVHFPANARLACVMALAHERLGVPFITTPAEVMTQDPRVAIAYTAELRNAIQVATDHQALSCLPQSGTEESHQLPASPMRDHAREQTQTAGGSSEYDISSAMQRVPTNGDRDMRLTVSRSEQLSVHSKVFELRRRRAVREEKGSPSNDKLGQIGLGRLSSLDRFGMAV